MLGAGFRTAGGPSGVNSLSAESRTGGLNTRTSFNSLLADPEEDSRLVTFYVKSDPEPIFYFSGSGS